MNLTNASPVHRFLLRLPGLLHEQLRWEADKAGLSLNEHCVRRLADPPLAPVETRVEGLGRAVTDRAAALFASDFIGAVLFGSWARAEARSSSDVDVLVIVDDQVALTRALYRRWDDDPLAWDGRVVDVHFAHVPAEPVRAGVWCDTAIDGMVLVDPSGDIHRALTRTRQAIADGRIARRTVHGHPYWVQAA